MAQTRINGTYSKFPISISITRLLKTTAKEIYELAIYRAMDDKIITRSPQHITLNFFFSGTTFDIKEKVELSATTHDVKIIMEARMY